MSSSDVELVFPKEFGAKTSVTRDVFLENEGKIQGGCVKEFFLFTCRLASRNFVID